MTNLARAVKASRWNDQHEAADFARDLGITTKEYLRFERGETVSVDVMLAIIRWALAPSEPPKQAPLASSGSGVPS
jgi:hypothetical protein